jgi:hypothetical protein
LTVIPGSRLDRSAVNHDIDTVLVVSPKPLSTDFNMYSSLQEGEALHVPFQVLLHIHYTEENLLKTLHSSVGNYMYLSKCCYIFIILRRTFWKLCTLQWEIVSNKAI